MGDLTYLLPPSRIPSAIQKASVQHLSCLCYISFHFHRLSLYSLTLGSALWLLVDQPTMASADSSAFFSSPLDDNSTRQIQRSPRVMRSLLHTYTCHIYVHAFRVSIGLQSYMPPYPTWPPHMWFLFVRSVLCFRFPPDNSSRNMPCPFS